MTVAVYYLARMAEGSASLEAFADSYRRHRAGIPHNLILICKGAERPEDVAAISALFAGIEHRAVATSDAGFDIQVYLQAAKTATADRLCFLNTFSRIEADDWLLKLSRALDEPGIGMAGATASYESLRSTRELIEYLRWLLLMRGATLPPDEAEQAYWLMRSHLAGSRSSPTDWRDRLGAMLLPRRPVGPDPAATYAADLRDVAPLDRVDELAHLPSFPNPHIRSNAVMIGRDLLNGFGLDVAPTKLGCFGFESGPDSLTRMVERQGLASVVVGADGRVFTIETWHESRTFRCRDRSNLLVSDNQTRHFEALPPPLRELFARVTWGDAPGETPYFGVPFPRRPVDRDVAAGARSSDLAGLIPNRRALCRRGNGGAVAPKMRPARTVDGAPHPSHLRQHLPTVFAADLRPRHTELSDTRDRYVLLLPVGYDLTSAARRRLRRMQILSFVTHQERRLRWPLAEGGREFWNRLSWPERVFATLASYLHIEAMSGRWAGWAYDRLLRFHSPNAGGFRRVRISPEADPTTVERATVLADEAASRHHSHDRRSS